MTRAHYISLTELVKGASPKPVRAKAQRLAAHRPMAQRPAAITVEPPGMSAGEIAALETGVARMEMATQAMKDHLAAMRRKQTEAEQKAATSAPSPIIKSDNRVSYRLSEAAKILGISPRSLRREVESGRLPHRLIGRITIISAAALEEFARGEA